PRLSAPYEALRTADGWIVVGAANQANCERLCRALYPPDLVDDARFARPSSRLAHRVELAGVLESVLAAESTAGWVERLLAAGVPCGPIHDMDEVLDDPPVTARETDVELPGAQGPRRHPGRPG